jgi:drug/metabolite transporter (DMT)-like permease
MSWFLIAVLSYLLLAVVNLFDKFLLNKVLSSTKTYVFLVCLLGSLVGLASPWFLEWPGLGMLLFNIGLGTILAFALYFLYESLKKSDASKVLIIIGGTIPIFSIILSVGFLGDRFSLNQWLGMALSLIGIFLIAIIPTKQSWWHRFWMNLGLKKKKSNRALVLALASALVYAIFFVGTKYAYQTQSFASAFIWIKLGSLVPVLYLLFVPKHRLEIVGNLVKKDKKKDQGKSKFLVLFNQILGAVSGILQNYAIFLGPVAIINALQGVQYAFLIVLGIIFTVFFPKIIKEDIGAKAIVYKGSAIILISLGLYLIAI